MNEIKLLKSPWHKKRNRVDLELKRVSTKVHTEEFIINELKSIYLEKKCNNINSLSHRHSLFFRNKIPILT